MLPSTSELHRVAEELTAAGCLNRAVSAYRKLLSIDPDDARALLKLGDLQLRLEQHDKALSAYERVAEHYFHDGNLIKAVAVYKHIHHIIGHYAPGLEPRYRHTIIRLAEILLRLGMNDDALAAFDRVAQSLLAEGRAIEVPPLYERLLTQLPDQPLTLLRLGEAQARVGDVDAAVGNLSRAATIMVNHGRRDDALKVLETLLGYRPDPVFAGIAAKLYLHRGDRQSAMAALAKLRICHKADPEAIEPLTLLARAFDQIHQRDKAIEVRKQAAWIAWRKGDRAAYEQIVSQLIAHAHDDPSVMQLVALRRVTTSGSRDIAQPVHDTAVDDVPPWLAEPIPA